VKQSVEALVRRLREELGEAGVAVRARAALRVDG
jgi:hypothetical protein